MRQVSFVEASGGKVLTGMVRQVRHEMARSGLARQGMAGHGRQGLDCSGLVQFGKSRLVKVWYGRSGIAWRG